MVILGFFSCAYWIFVCFFKEMSIQVFWPFLKWFFIVEFGGSLHILSSDFINHLSVVWFANILSFCADLTLSDWITLGLAVSLQIAIYFHYIFVTSPAAFLAFMFFFCITRMFWISNIYLVHTQRRSEILPLFTHSWSTAITLDSILTTEGRKYKSVKFLYKFYKGP